ncbi:MAG: phenylalanine--tRNA ligase beta subunit-related protein [Desulfobacterales bacterium]
MDDKDRILADDTLMICDGKKARGGGRGDGGLNSEIEATTTRVLIESAYFDPISIRKTAKRLTLNTDASHRFERGVDPEGTITALNRAAQLMADIGGGNLARGIIDEHRDRHLSPRYPSTLPGPTRILEPRWRRTKSSTISHPWNLTWKPWTRTPCLFCRPPSRVDVTRPEDLMEEVARLWGYNNINTTFPKISASPPSPASRSKQREKIKDVMAGYGFSESISYSFMAKDAGDRLKLAENDDGRRTLDIINPISEDLAVMRTTLIPGFWMPCAKICPIRSKSEIV